MFLKPLSLILTLLTVSVSLLTGPTTVARTETVGSVTGLPIPRYVTLQAEKVNVRTGPGVRYPVDWVFVRENMPVEIVSEFENWRKVRDFEGTEGWVHHSMLSGRRSVLVIGRNRTLRRESTNSAPAVAHLEPGVIAWLESCAQEWCEIEVSGLSGWVHGSAIWGIRVDESRR